MDKAGEESGCLVIAVGCVVCFRIRRRFDGRFKFTVRLLPELRLLADGVSAYCCCMGLFQVNSRSQAPTSLLASVQQVIWPACGPLRIKQCPMGVQNKERSGRGGEVVRNMGKPPLNPHQGPSYEADSIHKSVILLGFSMHCFYGEFDGTGVIRRKKQVVVSPGDVSARFHCIY